MDTGNLGGAAMSAADRPTRFCIVTPVLNGAAFIDETLASVLTQAGGFEIIYHVQDGASTDGTIERVKVWADLLHSGRLPVLCRGIRFTYASTPDGGMYDAINRAFARVLPLGDDVVMGWINADDRLAPGALSTICNIRRHLPDVTFLSGSVSLIDEAGSIIGANPPPLQYQRCMAAGLCDGRVLPFVKQEGTFWCAGLWHAIGGRIDTQFRLAGDWDLWRRIAEHAPMAGVDSVLGFHRRRAGQLSGQMDLYLGEIDTRLGRVAEAAGSAAADAQEPDGLSAEYQAVLEEFESLRGDPAKSRAGGYVGQLIRFNGQSNRWEKVPNLTSALGATELVSGTAAGRSIDVAVSAGFGAAEAGLPERNLPAGMRWLRAPQGEGEVVLPESGRYTVVLRCRNWVNGQIVSLTANNITIGRMRVAAHGYDRDTELRALASLAGGRQVLGVKVERPGQGDRNLLVLSWRVEPLLERGKGDITPVPPGLSPIGATAGPLSMPGGWPRISIVVPTRNQGQFIADTLESILRQGYPNLELIVADGASTDHTPDILRRYARHITHLISEPDSGQSNAINKGFKAASGEILTWLNSDDLLAKGALHAVALAFRTSGADLVAGVCDIFDDRNTTLHRHLPCLRDGEALPIADLLDLENCWLRGKFFHQPEVFFSRAIWEKAGGAVDETLYFSMDFDLWVRFAKAGGRISIIGRTLAHYRMHAAQKTSTPEAYKPELTAHAALLRRVARMPTRAERPLAQRLRVVMFNDYGFRFGAGIAHRRMAEALRMAGQDVVVLAYADFDLGPGEPALSAEAVAEAILAEKPDLILLGNLHHIGADFDLLGPLLEAKVPVVFYAHDEWLVTGRCGYTAGCTRYRNGCGADCPTADVYPALPPDRIAPALARKHAVLAAARKRRAPFAVFTNSRYMRDFLLQALPKAARPPMHVVHFGIDTQRFTHGKRWEARALLGLPTDRFIIMGGAANVEDPRKGMDLLMQAIRALPKPEQVMLLLVGYGTSVPELPCEVRFTGFIDTEDAMALNYQAADIFVGPSLHEALGQTYLEAGACGTPTVAFQVGGVVDAVLDGVTGLLLKEFTAEALLGGIQRLREDFVLRRQLGMQAVLHVRNRFSREASAAQLLATLVHEPALKLTLSPNVTLSARPLAPVAVRYLTGHGAGVARAEEQPDWLPLANMRGESGLASRGQLPERFWWARGPGVSLAVKAAAAGEHRLRFRCRCPVADQVITIAANGGPDRITVPVPPHPFGSAQDIDVDLHLRRGMNRISVDFAVWHEEQRGGRKLALLIEAIEVLPNWSGMAGAPDDGATEVLDGFSFLEGPYPASGLPNKFNWAVARTARLRVFSAMAGRRVLELRLRNFHPDQHVTIHLGDKMVLTRALPGTSMAMLHRLRFEAGFASGYQSVRIEVTRCKDAAPGERPLAFIYEGTSFFPAGELEPPPEEDAIRWDLSEGVGHEEGPYEKEGLLAPFRWVVAQRAVVVVDRTAEALADLRIRFRAPMQGQRALLRVNDGQAIVLDLDSKGFRAPGAVQAAIKLRRGRNRLVFEFAEMVKPNANGRGLVLLLEEVAIAATRPAAPAEPAPEAAPEAEAAPRAAPAAERAVAPPPAPPAPPAPADGTIEWLDGILSQEGPFPDQGLSQPFRWCVGEFSRFRVYVRAAGERRLFLRLRNFHPKQTVRVLCGGSELASPTLSANLRELQTVELAAALSAGWQVIELRPSARRSGGDGKRPVSILLEDVTIEEVAPAALAEPV